MENVLLQCSSSEAVTPEYFVISLQGKLMKHYVMEMFTGSVTYTIDVSAWPPGIYFMKIQLGKNIFSRKFIKR
jgi:hypothetical protein